MQYTRWCHYQGQKRHLEKIQGSRVPSQQEENGCRSRQGDFTVLCYTHVGYALVGEHDILGPNEILVGNGMVQGPVWICRSPCTAPGDIQRAYAMPRRRKEPFSLLDDVLIFSARGNRPFLDMLVGDDLDEDEYYVSSLLHARTHTHFVYSSDISCASLLIFFYFFSRTDGASID